MSKKKKKNIPFIISFIIFISAFVGLILYFHKTSNEEKQFKDIRAKLINKEEENNEEDEGLKYYLINGNVVWEGLKDVYMENNDLIGWVRIDDTNIDYPVMCTPEDEQFYIHKGFDKEYSFAGCIFANKEADIVSPSENIIMYGHHMISQTMFKPLDGYKDEEFYKKHKYIRFNTLRQTGTYEVIAAFSTKIYYDEKDGFMYYTYTDMGQQRFEEYVSRCKELTPYEISADAKYGDQLITLSTCAYHTSNGRFVVVAKRIDGKEVDLNKEPIAVINQE